MVLGRIEDKLTVNIRFLLMQFARSLLKGRGSGRRKGGKDTRNLEGRAGPQLSWSNQRARSHEFSSHNALVTSSMILLELSTAAPACRSAM